MFQEYVPLKRFLAFVEDAYENAQAMDGLVGDYDTHEEALAHLLTMYPTYDVWVENVVRGTIYDQAVRATVWTSHTELR